MKTIVNAHILTMTDTDIENGYIATDGNKIVEIGDMRDMKSDMGQIINAQGAYALPGLVDAHTHIGMWENALAFEGDDGNEVTDPITPQLRAIDAVNPLDRCFTEALEAGVTTVVTGPGSANPIGGSFVAMKTLGNCVDDMVINPCAAMKMAFGENPKHIYGKRRNTPTTRMGIAALIRETLFKAQDYANKKNSDKPPDFDFKLEALVPVLQQKLPVKIHAHRADDIFTALRIQREFNLRVTLEHCTDGYLIAQKLEDIPINIGPILSDRSKPELINLNSQTAGLLAEAGLRVAIITDHPCVPQNLLLLCAAMAHREGLSRELAIKAVTINAAKNAFIDQFVGSIEVGKHADVILLADDPLAINAKPFFVMCNGEVAFWRNKK